jgi:protease secretion system membrane fusion protein
VTPSLPHCRLLPAAPFKPGTAPQCVTHACITTYHYRLLKIPWLLNDLLSSSASKTLAANPIQRKPNQAYKQFSGHTGHAARIGLWALALGFGGLVLWAAFAPLDEGVPSQGMVAIDTKRKPVQHLTGGLVKEVLVGEGSHVKEGQLLIRLDEAAARANFEAARQRYIGLARHGRDDLSAEQRGQSKIVFHPDVIAASKDPQIRALVRNAGAAV